MDQEVRFDLLGRAEGEFHVGAVHRIAGLEGHHTAPSKTGKFSAQFRRSRDARCGNRNAKETAGLQRVPRHTPGSTCSHLLNLATHPLARRAGHASRLLAHIIEFGRQHGCRIVTLEVRRSNAAALRLYRRFAFRPVGVRPNYYAEDQEDAIVMLLDLE